MICAGSRAPKGESAVQITRKLAAAIQTAQYNDANSFNCQRLRGTVLLACLWAATAAQRSTAWCSHFGHARPNASDGPWPVFGASSKKKKTQKLVPRPLRKRSAAALFLFR